MGSGFGCPLFPQSQWVCQHQCRPLKSNFLPMGLSHFCLKWKASANGAPQPQPGATPQESHRNMIKEGLKARSNFTRLLGRAYSPLFQTETKTRGVAPG